MSKFRITVEELVMTTVDVEATSFSEALALTVDHPTRYTSVEIYDRQLVAASVDDVPIDAELWDDAITGCDGF